MPHREYQSVVNKLVETRAEADQYKMQLSTALNECLDTVYRENSLVVALNKKNAEVERLREALEKYADPSNWGDYDKYITQVVFEDAPHPGYTMARAALEVKE